MVPSRVPFDPQTKSLKGVPNKVPFGSSGSHIRGSTFKSLPGGPEESLTLKFLVPKGGYLPNP